MIVGGGTAGCVLAARICENLPDFSVTLLERGAPRSDDEDLEVQSPNLFFRAWANPKISEGWDSQPNPGLGGRTVLQYTGNTLGGSSAINGGQWTKPPLSTFDKAIWAFNGLPQLSHIKSSPTILSCVVRCMRTDTTDGHSITLCCAVLKITETPRDDQVGLPSGGQSPHIQGGVVASMPTCGAHQPPLNHELAVGLAVTNNYV